MGSEIKPSALISERSTFLPHQPEGWGPPLVIDQVSAAPGSNGGSSGQRTVNLAGELLRHCAEGPVIEISQPNEVVLHWSLGWFPVDNLGPMEQSLRVQGQLSPGLAVKTADGLPLLIYGHHEMTACFNVGMPFLVRLVDADQLGGCQLETLVVQLGTANYAAPVCNDRQRAIIGGRLYNAVHGPRAHKRKLAGTKLPDDAGLAGYEAAALAANVSVASVRKAVVVLRHESLAAAVMENKISLAAAVRCVYQRYQQDAGPTASAGNLPTTSTSIEAIDRAIATPITIPSDDEIDSIAAATLGATPKAQAQTGSTKAPSFPRNMGKRAGSTGAETRSARSGKITNTSSAIDGRPSLPRELDSTLRGFADELKVDLRCATSTELEDRLDEWGDGRAPKALVVVEADFSLPWIDLTDVPFAIITCKETIRRKQMTTKHLLVFGLVGPESGRHFVSLLENVGVVFVPGDWVS